MKKLSAITGITLLACSTLWAQHGTYTPLSTFDGASGIVKVVASNGKVAVLTRTSMKCDVYMLDGSHWKILSQSNGFPEVHNNTMNALSIGADGNLFIAGGEAIVTYDTSSKSWSSMETVDASKSREYKFLQPYAGKLFVQVNADSIVSGKRHDGVQYSTVRSVIEFWDVNGIVKTMRYSTHDDKILSVSAPPLVIGENIYVPFTGDEQKTASRMFVLERGADQPHFLKTPNHVTINERRAVATTATPQGNILVTYVGGATQNGIAPNAVMEFNPNTTNFAVWTNSLDWRDISGAVYYNGSMYLGDFTGLFSGPPDKIQTVDFKKWVLGTTGKSNWVKSLAMDGGILWLATEDGLYKLDLRTASDVIQGTTDEGHVDIVHKGQSLHLESGAKVVDAGGVDMSLHIVNGDFRTDSVPLGVYGIVGKTRKLILVVD